MQDPRLGRDDELPALALGRIGKASRGAIPALNRAARDETEAPDVRAAARDALRLIDRDRDN